MIGFKSYVAHPINYYIIQNEQENRKKNRDRQQKSHRKPIEARGEMMRITQLSWINQIIVSKSVLIGDDFFSSPHSSCWLWFEINQKLREPKLQYICCVAYAMEILWDYFLPVLFCFCFIFLYVFLIIFGVFDGSPHRFL